MRDRDDFLIQVGVYGAVGIQLATSVIVGLFLGGWLDKRFATAPWLTVIGLTLGSIGGFYNLFRILNWYQSRK